MLLELSCHFAFGANRELKAQWNSRRTVGRHLDPDLGGLSIAVTGHPVNDKSTFLVANP